MSEGASPYETRPIEPADATAGFSCGKRALDDHFARHAVPNAQSGVGRAYVLAAPPGADARLPAVLGFYTLSMASAESSQIAPLVARKLPRYPLPVARIGRLAVDRRAQGLRLGEALLVDALRRIVDAANLVGCLGVIVDAKDEDAARFEAKYDFATLTGEGWPRRMFLAMGTARAAREA
jgi:GNAT superfamily N-acetyltransferase